MFLIQTEKNVFNTTHEAIEEATINVVVTTTTIEAISIEREATIILEETQTMSSGPLERMARKTMNFSTLWAPAVTWMTRIKTKIYLERTIHPTLTITRGKCASKVEEVIPITSQMIPKEEVVKTGDPDSIMITKIDLINHF